MKAARRRWLALVAGGAAAAAGLARAQPVPAATPSRPATPPRTATSARGAAAGASRQAWAAAAALSRGINLSVFAAPREGDWGLRLDERWVRTLARAGFRSLRVQVRFSNHAARSADATLDEAFARRIDQLVDDALAHDMSVVLAQCFYSQLYGGQPDEGEDPVDPAVVRARFLNLWRQLARRHAARPARLLFELYNVPRGDAAAWNALAADAVVAIRAHDPRRVIVVAPLHNDAARLPELRLPPDPHLVATIHNREPREFSFQGSPWIEGADRWLGTPCCNAQQQAALAAKLDLAQAWSRAHGVPVWLGSFGAVSTAPMDSRARYLRAMRDAAEARGMSWAHVDFAANFNVHEPPLDSGIYDVVRRRWHQPLLDALLGP